MGAMSIADRLAARRGEIAANKSKGLRAYKFSAGTTKFRILPAKDPSAQWDRRFGVHYLKSFDGNSFVSIGDNEITYGTSDPVRELIFEAMRQAPTDEVKEHYRKMLASPRIVFQAFILSDPNQPPTDPVLIEVSEGAFDTILAQCQVWADANGDYDIVSLENGHVFQVEKTGSGLDTKYNFTATPQKAPLNEKHLERLIELDGWIASQFEAKMGRATEFLAKLNAAAGINVTIPAQLTAGTPATPALTAPTGPTAATPVQPQMVTTIIDDEPATPAEVIEDAVIEEVTTTDPDPTVAIDPAAIAAASAAATTPVQPAAPAEAADGTDLASILDQLK